MRASTDTSRECKWRETPRWNYIITSPRPCLSLSLGAAVPALFFKWGNKLRRNGLNKAPAGWHSAIVPVTNDGVCAFYAMSGEHRTKGPGPESPGSSPSSPPPPLPRLMSRARARANPRKSNRASIRSELMRSYSNQRDQWNGMEYYRMIVKNIW